jgi:hypothetical protein
MMAKGDEKRSEIESFRPAEERKGQRAFKPTENSRDPNKPVQVGGPSIIGKPGQPQGGKGKSGKP